MTDILISSIKEAILPELRSIIQQELRNKYSEELREKFLSVSEAQKMFEPPVSRGTLYNWETDGKIQSYLIGGKRFFKYSELIDAVQRVKKYQKHLKKEN